MSTTTASSAPAGAGTGRRRYGRRAALLAALALAVSGLAGPLGVTTASAAPALPDAATSPSGSAHPGRGGLPPAAGPTRARRRAAACCARSPATAASGPCSCTCPTATAATVPGPSCSCSTAAATRASAPRRSPGWTPCPAIVAYGNGVIGTGDGDRQAWEGAPYSAPGRRRHRLHERPAGHPRVGPVRRHAARVRDRQVQRRGLHRHPRLRAVGPDRGDRARGRRRSTGPATRTARRSVRCR